MAHDEGKRAAGFAAIHRYVQSGMKVGMGTGSTAVWAIRRIGEKLADGELTGIIGVATSSQAELECHALGIPLRSMNDPEIDGRLDLTIDGADEIDPERRLVKGGGGALLIEKIVAYASDRFVVVADRSKLVEHLGLAFAVPLEVLPLARVPVLNALRETPALRELGAEPTVRLAERKMGAVITDNGNILVDVRFREPMDPVAMEVVLSRIPGVLANGLFTRVVPTVLVGEPDGAVTEFG
ncbi:MAG: ribose-5-phosphate isomerase RpiA [Spirochaetota bacterium]